MKISQATLTATINASKQRHLNVLRQKCTIGNAICLIKTSKCHTMKMQEVILVVLIFIYFSNSGSNFDIFLSK